jgi:hypothetical protein
MTKSKSKSREGKTRYKYTKKTPKATIADDHIEYLEELASVMRQTDFIMPYEAESGFKHFIINSNNHPFTATVSGDEARIGDNLVFYAIEIAKEEIKKLYATKVKFIIRDKTTSIKDFVKETHRCVYTQESFRQAVRKYIVGQRLVHLSEVETMYSINGMKIPDDDVAVDDFRTIGEMREAGAKKLPDLVKNASDAKEVELSDLGDFIMGMTPDHKPLHAYSLDGTKVAHDIKDRIKERLDKLHQALIDYGFIVSFDDDMHTDALNDMMDYRGTEFTQAEFDEQLVLSATRSFFQFANISQSLVAILE